MISKLNELQTINQLIINGQPTFGVFDRVEEINYLDYHSYKLSNKAVASWRKKLRANQFCFIQIVQPPYRVCFAVATLNWVTSSFCYIYNEQTDELEIVEALQPFTRNTKFNQSTYKDVISFKSRKLSIDINFSDEALQVSLNSKLVTLNATLQRQAEPLSVCTPTGRTGWTYTQKEPITQIKGEMTIQGNTLIDLQGATATLDWSLGYMRRITNWFWVCISGYLASGQHFGLNLATGVNESGASENACWLDGKRYHLPSVMFKKGKTPTEDWQVSNQALNWSKVKIELTFTPVRCYQKNDRLVVVDSIFEQWVGYYSGYILLDTEQGPHKIEIDKLMGLAEDHYAKW